MSGDTCARRPSSTRLARQRARWLVLGPGRVEPAAVHRSLVFADHGEQPAPALAVGPGPGLTAPRRSVVRRVAGRPPGAPVADRAVAAPRSRGSADEGAELHERHRPRRRGRVVARQQALGERPLRLGHRRPGELMSRDDPGEHPAHIGVQDRVPLAVGEHRDRRGRVVPHTGEGDQVVVGVGHHAAVVVRDRSRGRVQPKGAPGIAQPAPRPDRLTRSLSGQGAPGLASARATARGPAAPGQPGSAGA